MDFPLLAAYNARNSGSGIVELSIGRLIPYSWKCVSGPYGLTAICLQPAQAILDDGNVYRGRMHDGERQRYVAKPTGCCSVIATEDEEIPQTRRVATMYSSA